MLDDTLVSEPCLEALMMDQSHRATALAGSEQWVINFIIFHETDTTDRQFTDTCAAGFLESIKVFLRASIDHLRGVILEQCCLSDFLGNQLTRFKLCVVLIVSVLVSTPCWVRVHSDQGVGVTL